jgi:hypothetical protein
MRILRASVVVELLGKNGRSWLLWFATDIDVGQMTFSSLSWA